MSMVEMPGRMGLIGALSGIPVVEEPILRYDEMYIGQTENKIAVGEVNHFFWRIDQIDRNKVCREIAAQHIKKEAERILGEPFELRS